MINVGANFGYYAVLLAALVGEQGRLVAYEPQSKLADLIRASLEVNGLAERCTVQATAAGAQTGIADLSQAVGHTGSAHLAGPGRNLPGYTWINRVVPVRTIDELDLPRLDLLVSDAEGSDYAAVQGAQQTLARSPKAMLVLEHNPHFFSDPEVPWRPLLNNGWYPKAIDYSGTTRPVTLDTLRAEPKRIWNLLWQRDCPS